MSGKRPISPDDLRDEIQPAEEETGSEDLRGLPPQADRRATAADPDRMIREIKGMLVGDDYEYARDTLEGILKTIERTKIVTENQWRAVDNIAAKPTNREQWHHRERDRSPRGRYRREYYDR